jgi:hypothetical protein
MKIITRHTIGKKKEKKSEDAVFDKPQVGSFYFTVSSLLSFDCNWKEQD